MAQKDISSAQREFPTITLQEGYGNTREIPINRKSLIIGRENDSDIVIAEPNVSWHHAVISSTAEGVFSTLNGSIPLLCIRQKRMIFRPFISRKLPSIIVPPIDPAQKL